MFRTRITEMLGIEYPIIQGGMLWVSCPELTAAVSNAGGLGVLISAPFRSGEELRKEIIRTKELTDKPFGVNISLFPAARPIPNDEFIDVIVEEGVRAVESSGHRAPPPEYVEKLRKANVKLIHKCAAVRHAQSAERAGVDAVTVVGYENGGATGMYDVTTMVLVPLTVDAVQIPVLAGGGIADARGFVAALALGAEGVVVGTRFMATKESPAHPSFKEWMLRARETETMLVQRSIRNTHRVLRSPFAEKVYELESKGATLEELLPWISGERSRRVLLNGELEEGAVSCGQVVGLINSIVSAKEVIEEMVEGAIRFQERLSSIIGR